METAKAMNAREAILQCAKVCNDRGELSLEALCKEAYRRHRIGSETVRELIDQLRDEAKYA